MPAPQLRPTGLDTTPPMPAPPVVIVIVCVDGPSWVDTDFGVDSFLAHFPLEAGQFARLTECRRLLALLWLISLSLVAPDDDRNPPDTPARQARRLRALLDTRTPSAAACREPAGGTVPG